MIAGKFRERTESRYAVRWVQQPKPAKELTEIKE